MVTNNYLWNPNAVMLHNKTRHTNKDIPYNRFVAGEDFPDQISELLNTEVTLKYRDHNIVDINLEAEPYERPSDDEEYYVREMGPDDFDQIDVYEDKFRVVRADNSEPFVLVGISSDYSKVLVNSTKKESDGEYRFKTHISRLPKQDNTYFGLDVFNRHTGEIERLNAVTIRVDDNEPTYSVLVEFLGSTNVIRITLGDETISHIQNYMDEDYDFDARDAANYAEHYADINGLYASHNNIVTMNIDGGRAGNLDRLFFNRHVGDVGIEDLKNEPNDDTNIDINFGELVDQPDIDYDMNANGSVENLSDHDVLAICASIEMYKESTDNNITFITISDGVPIDYNFGDLLEDDPVIGDDDNIFNFGDEDELYPEEVIYDMNQDTKEIDYDFGEIPDDLTVYDYDMNNDILPSIDYEFGDIETGEYTADYDMELGNIDYNFGELDYDPPYGEDDQVFNGGDIDYTDPDMTIYIDPDDPDDCIFNFRDLDFTDPEDAGYSPDDDDGIFNFGDIDANTSWEYYYDMNNEAYSNDFDFYNIDMLPPVEGEDDYVFNFGDLDYDESIYFEPDNTNVIHYIPPDIIIYNDPDDDQVYNFGDLDYDPPVEGEDDGVNNYGDLDEYNFDTGQEWYEEGDPKYIECDFDFGEYMEDPEASNYDFGDLDNPDRVIKDQDIDLGEVEETEVIDYDMNIIGDSSGFSDIDAICVCIGKELYESTVSIKIDPVLITNRDIISVCLSLDMYTEKSRYESLDLIGGIPIDFNFHDQNEDPAPEEDDDHTYNFMDLDWTDPDYQPEIIDDDDEVLNFGDIDIDPPDDKDKMDNDDYIFNFGDLDFNDNKTYFDINDLNNEYRNLDYDCGELPDNPGVNDPDYNFGDLLEDDAVSGPDDGDFNFAEVFEQEPMVGDYDFDFNESLDSIYKDLHPELYPKEEVKTNHIKELTKDDIKYFRRMIFEGREIYGSV